MNISESPLCGPWRASGITRRQSNTKLILCLTPPPDTAKRDKIANTSPRHRRHAGCNFDTKVKVTCRKLLLREGKQKWVRAGGGREGGVGWGGGKVLVSTAATKRNSLDARDIFLHRPPDMSLDLHTAFSNELPARPPYNHPITIRVLDVFRDKTRWGINVETWPLTDLALNESGPQWLDS